MGSAGKGSNDYIAGKDGLRMKWIKIDRVLEAHPAALIEHGGVAQVDAKSLTVLGVENNVKE